MSAPVDSSGLDRVLSQTMQALDRARGATKPDDEEAEPIEGVGLSADGLIRAAAVAGGRLSELFLDPRVLRMTTVTLAEELMVAVNGAMADLQERIREAAGTVDLDELANQLKDVQEESSRQMSTFLQALTDAQQRIAGSAG
jgi:DNA-binding protein YbaB